MRKLLLAFALYFVIAVAVETNQAFATALPATTVEAITVASTPINDSAFSEAQTPVKFTAEQVMEMLLKLAQPDRKPTKDEICETLAAAAQSHDLPLGFFVRLIQQESGFNPEAVSPVGAQGIAQFMPKVAEEWGLENAFDPHQALPASARFLRALREQFGNWGLAAAAYNGGMGRIQKWIDKRGKLPAETRNYVLSITGIPAEQWKSGTPRKVSFSIPPRAPCQELAALAGPVEEIVPLPRPRVAPETIVAAAEEPQSAKKRGRRGVSRVAAVRSKITAPAPIVAEASSSRRSKGKRGKSDAAVKVAAKAPAKSASKGSKKSPSKGRVQVADARSNRK